MRHRRRGTGLQFDATIAVIRHYVQSFMAHAPGIESTETANLTLSKIVRYPDKLRTRTETAALCARIRQELPALLRSLHNIVQLEPLVNDGSIRYGFGSRPTRSRWDLYTGCSRIILAYLVQNPEFETMVADSDAANTGGPNPDNTVHGVAKLLRAKVKPLV